MRYELRPAVEADYDFLYALVSGTMREYVAATWGWDEAFQRRLFRERFQAAAWQIVVLDGQPAGALSMRRGTQEIFLSNLHILPGQQGRGLGTSLVRAILDEARAARVPVALTVLKANPRARELYERLGFRVTGEDEAKIRYKMSTAERV